MSITNQLIELIKSNPRYAPTATHYVSVYHKEQLYGGPEEGGWWHTVYQLEGSVAFPSREQAEAYIEHAEQLAEQLQIQANRQFRDAFVMKYRDDVDLEDDFCTGETIDAGEYLVHVEETQGSLDNSRDVIPHWE
jgi:hypothetical protein